MTTNAKTVSLLKLSADRGLLSNDFLTNTARQTVSGLLSSDSAFSAAPLLYLSADGGLTRVLAKIDSWTNRGVPSAKFSADVSLLSGTGQGLSFWSQASGGVALGGTQAYKIGRAHV